MAGHHGLGGVHPVRNKNKKQCRNITVAWAAAGTAGPQQQDRRKALAAAHMFGCYQEIAVAKLQGCCVVLRPNNTVGQTRSQNPHSPHTQPCVNTQTAPYVVKNSQHGPRHLKHSTTCINKRLLILQGQPAAVSINSDRVRPTHTWQTHLLIHPGQPKIEYTHAAGSREHIASKHSRLCATAPTAASDKHSSHSCWVQA